MAFPAADCALSTYRISRAVFLTAMGMCLTLMLTSCSSVHSISQEPQSHATVPTSKAWPQEDAPDPMVPTLRWKRCEETEGAVCAQAQVPLSYDDVNGAQILIDVAKVPASHSEQRIGSIFVNPGGPGESAITRIERFLKVLGPEVTNRFDVIAMDPRGVGESSKARCWSTKPEPTYVDSAPADEQEVKDWLAHDAYVVRACQNSGQPIINHISTANVARDMDLIRQAVGDEKLTFYGVSYGTVLAATYSSLFPQNVRAMVLDGVVNPVLWTSGGDMSAIPVSLRTGSAEAALSSLKALMKACKEAGEQRCHHGSTIEDEWDKTVAALRKGPVRTGDDTRSLVSLMYSIVALQYDPADALAVIELVHDSYQEIVLRKTSQRAAARLPRSRQTGVGFAAPLGTPAEMAPSTATQRHQRYLVPPTKEQPFDVSWWESFTQQGTMCVDSVNPRDPQAWVRIFKMRAGRDNPFTSVWLWNSSLCAQWPGKDVDAYRGPFRVRPNFPLLIVGNTHDNVTAWTSAQQVAQMIPGSRLLTVDAFGHTAAEKSRCASRIMRAYLVRQELPAEGTRCAADRPLF